MNTMRKNISYVIFLFILGCSGNNSRDNIIIGIPSDVQTFNPAYTMTMTEGNISELIYLGLVGYNWNKDRGELDVIPMLAEKWEWAADSSSVTVTINEKASWSDGNPVTSDDVVFTYDVYSDPDAETKFFGIFENFNLKNDLAIDLDKTFEKISEKVIKINFSSNRGSVSTFDFDLPLLPKHIFEKVNRKELINSDLNLNPVGTGPYTLKEWKKNQFVKLELNRKSFLAEDGSVNQLVFKIIPNYNNMIVQLRKNEIDFLEEVKFEDLKQLKDQPEIVNDVVKGRDYDYLGLNNIDPEKFGKGIIEGNRFFADSLVRKAFAYAIDRDVIIDEYMGGYGKKAVTPVAPIFKSIIDTTIKPYPYSPKIAKELLLRAGWKDSDDDGVLDKNGLRFSFKLTVQGTNKLRNEIAVLIKDNLKQVGIDAVIEQQEPSVFVQNMFQKKFDAFISGWTVPIPVDLKPYWNSDLKNNPANTAGYRNKKVDAILDKLKKRLPALELKNVYFEFQRIIHNEVPSLFLFWSDRIVSYNKRIKNADLSPLGTIHYCWKWRLAD